MGKEKLYRSNPKITKIKLEYFYESVYNDGCLFTYCIIFDGKTYERFSDKQRINVTNKIKSIISAELVGKTWDELAEEGGKE